jgi:hypothetical protein
MLLSQDTLEINSGFVRNVNKIAISTKLSAEVA